VDKNDRALYRMRYSFHVHFLSFTALVSEVPTEVSFVLGGRHYNTPELHENYDQTDRLRVTTTYGRLRKCVR